MFEERCLQQYTSAPVNFLSVYCAQTLLFFLMVIAEPGWLELLCGMDSVRKWS